MVGGQRAVCFEIVQASSTGWLLPVVTDSWLKVQMLSLSVSSHLQIQPKAPLTSDICRRGVKRVLAHIGAESHGAVLE